MNILQAVNDFVWGVPTLILILGTGLYLSLRTGFVQIRLLPKSIMAFFGQFRHRGDSAAISPYRALCTALAATVGTGNLVGVAGAIALGGPGAIFWMWICALLGMVTKFSEAALAVRYRKRQACGEYVGGPMYMIAEGLGRRWKWLAIIYCLLGTAASFGVGNATQVNAVITGIKAAAGAIGLSVSRYTGIVVACVLAALIASVLLGGAKRIGAAAEQLVPMASVGYILMCTVLIILRAKYVPAAFMAVFQGAFTPEAVTGGLLGSAFQALRVGASRGTFTNEAGMGTASIAHAGAQVNHPVEQGMMGIMEVFLDTVVICTMTAVAILCSGIPISYGTDTGGALTVGAFSAVLGQWSVVVLALTMCCLAVATILGWSLYGARCAQFLFGDKAYRPYVFLQTAVIVWGAVMNTGTVWQASEILNGLMAIPNLTALILLSPELGNLLRQYRKITSG